MLAVPASAAFWKTAEDATTSAAHVIPRNGLLRIETPAHVLLRGRYPTVAKLAPCSAPTGDASSQNSVTGEPPLAWSHAGRALRQARDDVVLTDPRAG
jgi:hypothetical protein